MSNNKIADTNISNANISELTDLELNAVAGGAGYQAQLQAMAQQQQQMKMANAMNNAMNSLAKGMGSSVKSAAQ
jgi:hypothetical protein